MMKNMEPVFLRLRLIHQQTRFCKVLVILLEIRYHTNGVFLYMKILLFHEITKVEPYECFYLRSKG